mmetsp:Transcript_7435/g.16849  ORF Transcript_7435/g.16849 Transcript_7435/m.16849 type:complete len:1166 (-) Transcript_7435:911-4408(-)|eukprot:CAMPEP_0172308956 /NCGR_PEP_ID=MMETSP1058-20130122/9394_1 /TAXON_ID=83371 /ORGANISM="Detonula confervacea, Strain CCMP 353" /LENGTH=1165 /DNA_ID=CAMNT_0013021491 /DNA_START=37 /DNA_END=3534 /DNA_ORIENTATION=+
MITLRGKLTRTLVERKPPEPKITRSTVVATPATTPGVPPPALGVMAPPPAAALADIAATVANTGDIVQAIGMNAVPVTTDIEASTLLTTATTAVTVTAETPLQKETEAKSAAQIETLGPFEEWTWRGVWAFGDLPEDEEEKKRKENEEKKRSAEHGENVDNNNGPAGKDGTDVKEEAKEATNQQQQQPSVNNPPTPTEKVEKRVKKTPGRKKKDNSVKPRPFTYRWIKSVDADGVIVPSSLIIMAREAEEEELEKKAAEGDAGENVVTNAEGATAAGDDIVKIAVQDAETIVSAAEGAEKKEATLSSEQPIKENSGSVSEKPGGIATAIGDAVMGEAAVAPNKQSQQALGDAKDGDGDAVMKDAEGGSKPTIQTGENETLDKADVAASTQPIAAAAQTEATTASKESKMKTFGEQPYTDASQTHPLTCPASGKWEGHFENVVPNTTSSKKKRKSGGRSADNRIREMFYLFFNATPPKDAKEIFVESDSTIKANGMLDGDKSANDVADKDAADIAKSAAANTADGDASKPAANANSSEEAPNQQPPLPKSHIHVRGYGTNRFGTFEIVGSFNPQTGTLQCQRMYVPVPTADEIAKVTGGNGGQNDHDDNRRSSNSGRFLSGLDLTIPGEDEDRPRSTRSVGRKRKSTWKKRELDSSTSFEEFRVGADGNLVMGGDAGIGGAIGALQGGAGSGTIDIASIVKKRSRLSNEIVVGTRAATPGGITGGGGGSLKPLPQCRGGSLDSSLKIHIPLATATTLTSAGATKPSPSPRAASLGSGKKSKKKKSKGQQQPAQLLPVYKGPMPNVSPPVSIIPTLPTAGDPFLARWRAAHYLYYQRVEQEPEGDGQGSSWAASNHAAAGNLSSSSGAAGSSSGGNHPNLVKINVVVYEGEMHDGVRSGRGVCLYNNNTLYEGQWKRNKEHGTGTLMTADRKRIIYAGAWEKGKMHGHGAYYYYRDVSGSGGNTNKAPPQENGKYIGQFRQNLRNGHGVYTLPDGSIYDGEFRDNIQNGYGIFRWTDNSIYEGPWRDGKRHGAHGILVASDGFRYEGSWQNNSMEGRGVATYPKGQIYDGTWVQGKREGRGTIRFTNSAVYEGRFKDDFMEGQGTMKMNRNVIIPKLTSDDDNQSGGAAASDGGKDDDVKHDWMIPLQFQSDIGHIHQKAGFTQIGL